MSEEVLPPDATQARESTPGSRATPGSLYVVATPLGNARDLTLRALDILRTVDVIAAEDTRVTLALLRRYGIATKAVSLHAHNEARRAASLIAALGDQKSVAIVSDAGTPAISDPGARLVRAVHDAGYAVVPDSMPSASCSSGFFHKTQRRGVNYWPASRPCPLRSSSMKRRIASAKQ